MTIAELDDMIEQTESVEVRLGLIRKAWEMADADKDYDAQIYYRLEYIHQTCHYYDSTESYVIFPEVLKLHDNRVKEYGYDNNTWDILFYYKWLLENAEDFYQISRTQYETLWEDCKKRYMQNNYSLRPLYSYKFIFYMDIDRSISEEAYEAFFNQRRDSISDCHACERAREIEYFLGIDELGKAVTCAQPLIDGRLTCGEEPECTWGRFLRYYNGKILSGDSDYVEAAGNICEKLKRTIDRKGTATAYISEVLLYYAMEKPEKALNYYKKHWSYFETHRNPVNRYWFAIAALGFLHNIKDKKTYKMQLDSSFPFYNEENTYDVGQLVNHYKEAGLDIAVKIDKRNGTDVYTDRFNDVLSKFGFFCD